MTNSTHTAERRAQVAQHLRMLAAGRLAYAEPLAALLVPEPTQETPVDAQPKKARKAS